MAETSTPKVPMKIKLDLSGKQRLMAGLSWEPLVSKDAPNPEANTQREKIFTNDVMGIFHRVYYYLYEVKRSYSFLVHIRSAEKDEDGKGREKNYAHYDLDLLCYVLDKEGKPAAYSGPAAADMIDKEEVVYHSGEDYSGYGGNDDEQVHIEMNHIPEAYQNIFFIAASDSKFSLNQVKGPSIRLVDCKTEKTITETPIKAPVDKETYAYLYGRLYRKGSEWFFQEIGEFTDGEQDWPVYLKKYI
ncbi:MAG: TerD family protein [Alphaproteobacteria bacterium]|nr:TerD family protein [Alphaproteobacteria bacterium]QQS56570.1 MAG: TerD family protein [Alphaproteobacteria bacterium]